MFKLILLLMFSLSANALSIEEREREVELKEREQKAKEKEIELEERTLKLQEKKLKSKKIKKIVAYNWTNRPKSNNHSKYYFKFGSGYRTSDLELDNSNCWSSDCGENIVENRVNGSSTRIGFSFENSKRNRFEFYYTYSYIAFEDILNSSGGATNGFGFSHLLTADSSSNNLSPYFKYGFEFLTSNFSNSSDVQEGLMDGFNMNIGFGLIYKISKIFELDLSVEKGIGAYYIDLKNECDYFDNYYGSCTEEFNDVNIFESNLLILLSATYSF